MKPGLACCAALLVLACTASAASAAPRDRVAPSIPGELRVIAVTEDSITLSWNASTDNSGKVHAYIVNGVYHPGTSTTKTFTGLFRTGRRPTGSRRWTRPATSPRSARR